jgi:MazG family protein
MADDGPRKHGLADLLNVMARLRDPDTGCPWDVKQSFATIAPYTIEEAYEVADAIARDDIDGLKDELGDLLLQVVYHAQMASEAERFAFADVVDAITRKMIRRHPHVFEDASRRDEFMRTDLWDRIKAEEKAERGEDPAEKSVLADVPVGLPGLTRAAVDSDPVNNSTGHSIASQNSGSSSRRSSMLLRPFTHRSYFHMYPPSTGLLA